MTMDIYDYLKMDHKKVAKLFDLYKTATSDRNKLEIIVMITTELIIHADSEANTFYKALEFHRKSEDEAFHGEEEHIEIKAKLTEISKFKTMNPTLNKKLLELQAIVEHHVSDEEGKIFRAAKNVLSDEEAYALKERMHAYKGKMKSVITVHEEEITLELQ